MRSKNILYAMMFASLCLATTGCDKELPLSAASSGDSRGYRVPVFAAQAVGHVQPQNVSINSADKNHEDQVVSLQVVSKQKIMAADKPYYNAENWVANSTNYITFTNFDEKEDEVYYVANLLYDHYFSLDKSSPKYIENLSRETIKHCTPPFIMTAKNLNLTYNWNARKVYTDNGNNELKDIVLERSIAGVDVEFKLSDPTNFDCKSITVDKVELMNIPDRIGLTQPIQYEEVDSIPLNPLDPEGKKELKITSYYDKQDNFLGKKPEDFKDNYSSDIYVPNFIEPLGDALVKTQQEKHLSNGDVAKDSQGNPVMETVYSISLGKGIPVLKDRESKQAIIPRRYVPENKSKIDKTKTKLRFTLTKILNDGISDTRYYYLTINKEIKRNTIYKYVVSIDSWKNDIKFSIVSTVRPWTYVKYTEDFDLDY